MDESKDESVGMSLAVAAVAECPNKKAKMEGRHKADFSESKFVKYYKAGNNTSEDEPVTGCCQTTASSPPLNNNAAQAASMLSCSHEDTVDFSPKNTQNSPPLNYSCDVQCAGVYGAGLASENKENLQTDRDLSPVPNPLHDTPPSKVIHCRAVADGTKETDLISVLQPFGKITYVALLPKIRQALVEFELIESAVALVQYAQPNPIMLLGRQMYVNFSKSQEIKRDKIHGSHFSIPMSPQSPGEDIRGNILLLTIMNALYSIDVSVISHICSPYGNVLKIVIFHKNGLQSLVEFDSVESSEQAKLHLNGQDIYPGCCTLKVEYSRAKKLNVYKNDDETWDFTLDKVIETGDFGCKGVLTPLNGMGMTNSQLSMSNEALAAKISAFPTVHSILSKLSVLPGNSSVSPDVSQCDLSSSFNSSMDGSNSDLASLFPSVPSSPGGLSPLPISHQAMISTGQPILNPDGGLGCVLMVYGLNPDRMNCDRLFNLFCLYGNVIKIKFLTNKPGVAMIQMSDKMASEMIIKNLNGLELFECKLVIAFSKHPYIAGSSTVNALNDGTPATVTYTENRNNRFKYIPEGQSLKNRYQPPTRMLHFFNAPRNCTLDQLKDVFISSGADSPIRGTFFSKGSAKSSSGLLEMPKVQSAAEAVVLVNHVTINPEGGGSYTLKLAFSPSSTITPSAPTVAPAVAAAAASGLGLGNRSPRRETFSEEFAPSRLGPIGSRPLQPDSTLLLVS